VTAADALGDARIARQGQVVLVDRLVDDELVGVRRHHRRLAEGNHADFRSAGIECLVLGRGDEPGVAQVVPHGEPFDHVVDVRPQLAFGGVERLAALAAPVVEHRLSAGAIGHAFDAVADVGRGELLRDLAHGVIGPGVGRQVDARFLEGGGVDQHGHRVGAEADAVELAVDLAALELVLVEIVELQGAADELVERGDGIAAGVLDDEAVVHLQHVRRIAAGNLRRQLRPIVVPGEELAFRCSAAGCRGKGIGNGKRAVGAGLPAPPDQPQGCCLRHGWSDGSGGQQGGSAHEKLTPVDTHCHDLSSLDRCRRFPGVRHSATSRR
jgi:hypothetical protein